VEPASRRVVFHKDTAVEEDKVDLVFVEWEPREVSDFAEEETLVAVCLQKQAEQVLRVHLYPVSPQQQLFLPKEVSLIFHMHQDRFSHRNP